MQRLLERSHASGFDFIGKESLIERSRQASIRNQMLAAVVRAGLFELTSSVRSFKSYQTSGSAQRSAGEPRQAGNGATVARRACVAGKSGVWPILVNGE